MSGYNRNYQTYTPAPGEVKTTPWLCIPGCIWVKGEDDKAQGKCLLTGITVDEIKFFINQRIRENKAQRD